MKSAILIPSFWTGPNTSWLLRQCLQSIKKVEPGLMRSVVVTDDASPNREETAQICGEFGVSVLWKPKNDGYSSNINYGLRFLRRKGVEIATLLNNDVEIQNPFIEESVKLFEKWPKLSVIGYGLYKPDGRIQHNSFSVNCQHEINMPDYNDWGHMRPSGFAQGVTGAWQTLHLGRCGEYPTQYLLGYEDVDFCLTEWENDRQVYFTRHAIGIHHESATRGTQLGPKEFESLKAFLCRKFDIQLIEHRLLNSRLLEEEFPVEQRQQSHLQG